MCLTFKNAMSSAERLLWLLRIIALFIVGVLPIGE